MAIKTLRVFQEFTSEGYIPMPVDGNIDYGYTIAGTFPTTTPSTFQTDDPDLDVSIMETTDYYVWIRSHGTAWNPMYTRNVRVYPDSPAINNVVMGIIIARLDDAVPYTGATDNVNLGEFGLSGGFIDFDTTPTSLPTTAGTLSWNDGNGTLELIMKGGNISQPITANGVELAYNAEATTLNKGEIVYIYGAQGNRISVKRASNATEISSSVTIGMVAETITSGAEGFIRVGGTQGKLNTSGLTEGAQLWLGNTPGTYTQTKPDAPLHAVLIGYVERVHATAGSIYVKVQNGYELDELHNVSISSIANNQALIYDFANSLWENRTIVGTNGYIPYSDSTDLFKDSIIYTNGIGLGFNTTSIVYRFNFNGNTRFLEEVFLDYTNPNIRLKGNSIDGSILNFSNKIYLSDYSTATKGIIVDLSNGSLTQQGGGNSSFSGSITATSLIKSGGLSTEFLKADGSVDNNTYLTTSSASSTYQPLLSLSAGYIPKATSLSALGNSLIYDNGSGIGINTTSISKTLQVNGTAEISGTITLNGSIVTGTNPILLNTYFRGASSGFVVNDNLDANNNFIISDNGNTRVYRGSLTLGSVVGTGTGSLFAGAINGSTLSISGTSTLSGQIITGTNPILLNGYIRSSASLGFLINDNADANNNFQISDSGNVRVFRGSLTLGSTVGVGTGNLFASAGTFASTLTANSFVKSGGTSTQYLMADGSTSTFSGVTGSGTSGYLSKWDTSSAINNSIVYDNGTNVTIGGTSSLYKLTVVPTSGVNFGVGVTSIGGTNNAVFINAANDSFTSIPMGINGSVVVFSTSYTESGRIDDSQNWLIGATTPLTGNGKLQITGDVNITGNFRINGTAILSGTANYLTKWSTSTITTNSIAYDDGTNISIGSTASLYKLTVTPLSGINFGAGVTSYGGTNNAVALNASDASFGRIPMTLSASVIGFFTGFTEAGKIDSSQNWILGTSAVSGGGKLQVNGFVNVTSDMNIGGSYFISNRRIVNLETNDIAIGYASGGGYKTILYGNNGYDALFTVANDVRIQSGKNFSMGTTLPSFGSGEGVMFIQNATTNPSTNPSGGGILYTDGGALKYRGSSGTVTTIANA